MKSLKMAPDPLKKLPPKNHSYLPKKNKKERSPSPVARPSCGGSKETPVRCDGKKSAPKKKSVGNDQVPRCLF